MEHIKKRNVLIAVLIIILVLIISIIGYTFAYFAYTNSNNSTINGNAAEAKITLNIEKIVPTNDNLKLIPLTDSALSNAIAGSGGQRSCIDANGNLSCQVYKITLTNVGTITLKLKGTIKIDVNGKNNIFQHLKWRRLETATTINDDYVINGMTESVLDDNLMLDKNVTKNYYIALWLSETNKDQTGEDYGTFQGIVKFDDVNGKGATARFDS